MITHTQPVRQTGRLPNQHSSGMPYLSGLFEIRAVLL